MLSMTGIVASPGYVRYIGGTASARLSMPEVGWVLSMTHFNVSR
jgi:hypothetical protein